MHVKSKWRFAMKYFTLLGALFTILISSNQSFSAEKYKLSSKSDVINLAKAVGSQSASNAWHFNNLYDASSRGSVIKIVEMPSVGR